MPPDTVQSSEPAPSGPLRKSETREVAPSGSDGAGRTRRVRAHRVIIGDALPYFDTQAHEERTMLVQSVDLRGEGAGPYAVVLTLTVQGAKRAQRYLQPFRWDALVCIHPRRP